MPCRRLRKILQTVAAKAHKCKTRTVRKVVNLRAHNVLRRRLQSFRLIVSHLKKRLASVNRLEVEQALAGLPDNQLLLVKQCLKQSKVKSPRGMRYDHNWILSCILLRIKSPKAYSHLRDHKFLPLPSRNTLGRYIDAIRAETGISEEILAHLQSKLGDDADRHGVLMFDEIKLRHGIRFNTKSLRFEGLVDLTEFGYNGKEYEAADTGLVFMYRPLMASWVQSVAVYLSKGPTPSSTLTKLLLKIIFALESHGFLVR
jgi:hypothetical protein